MNTIEMNKEEGNMPNQLPYGFMGNQSIPNYNPNMSIPFTNMNSFDNDYKIMELEKRITNLEQRMKSLENEIGKKQSYDYHTSMNMM